MHLLPDFLPQSANIFTRIYPSHPWHFATLVLSLFSQNFYLFTSIERAQIGSLHKTWGIFLFYMLIIEDIPMCQLLKYQYTNTKSLKDPTYVFLYFVKKLKCVFPQPVTMLLNSRVYHAMYFHHWYSFVSWEIPLDFTST